MSNTEAISLPTSDAMSLFDTAFRDALKVDNAPLTRIIDYTFLSQGKKMRPLLVMLSAELVGKVNDATIRSAVALELLHAASLIHDDVVDESQLRRGKEAVHTAFGNKKAVLAGDFFLSSSLNEAVQTGNIEIVEQVAALGRALVQGEILQLTQTLSPEGFSEEVYYNIIQNKTAVLFTTCALLGYLSTGVKNQTYQTAIADFGKYLGICFQMKDDLFDFDKKNNTGKPCGNDILEGKLTLPLIYVFTQGDEERKKDILNLLQEKDIAKLQLMAFELGGIDYTKQRLNEFKQKAIDALNVFDDSTPKQALIQYLNFVVEREN